MPLDVEVEAQTEAKPAVDGTQVEPEEDHAKGDEDAVHRGKGTSDLHGDLFQRLVTGDVI